MTKPEQGPEPECVRNLRESNGEMERHVRVQLHDLDTCEECSDGADCLEWLTTTTDLTAAQARIAELEGERDRLMCPPMPDGLDDYLASLEGENRAWMTREDLEGHYVCAMANWQLMMNERDEARSSVAELEAERDKVADG